MIDGDQRFYVPGSLPEQQALARIRVRQRRAGLTVMLPLALASIIVTAAIALGGRLDQPVARQLLPGALMWTVMTVVGLTIVACSALTWFVRLRRLTRCLETAHDRPDLHRHHHRIFRHRRRLHQRLRTAVRRAS
jgi:hypothetical protein